MITEDFSRIAAQTAKQVIVQKIRESERQSVLEEYQTKEGTLVGGTVHRFIDNNIIIELGKAEGILPVREQVRRERFSMGERVKVLVLKVERGPRGPKILLSRSHPLVVQRLFEQEVPEVYEKMVEVMDVVREPGFRSKVAVKSNNPKIDPVGACVGVKGSRVRPIIDELRGERIDLNFPFHGRREIHRQQSVAGEERKDCAGEHHQRGREKGRNCGCRRRIVAGDRQVRTECPPGGAPDRLAHRY